MAKVSVVEAAREANAFRRDNWWRPIGPMVLVVVGATLSALWQKPAPAAAGLADLMRGAGWIMAYGALYRLAFAREHPDDLSYRPGRSGFQWRAIEWRLIGLALLGLAVLLAAVCVFGLVYVLAGGAVRSVTAVPTTPPPALAVVVGILLVCGLIYLALRLSMAAPATVDAGEIRFIRTWPLTRGAAWPIFLAHLLIAAVVLGFSLVAVFGGTALGAIAGAAASFAASGPEKMATIKDLTGAGAALGGAAVQAFVGLPLSVGLAVAIYRMLRNLEPAT